MQQGKDNQSDPSPPENSGEEIRRILALASQPQLPPDAINRVMARLAGEAQTGNVISLPERAARQRHGWSLAALPLAASLALGILLGAQGRLDFILPDAITGGESFSEETSFDDLGGMGEADAVAEENLS
ncbi:hypothetical protein [Aestuariivirga sp.]|jgi:hypothetical protein|uniref:hypothetical protein n=1 Tax=Aestuariivirga sp. TaxID=2650926 RepID=UPI003783D5D6